MDLTFSALLCNHRVVFTVGHVKIVTENATVANIRLTTKPAEEYVQVEVRRMPPSFSVIRRAKFGGFLLAKIATSYRQNQRLTATHLERAGW